MGSFNVTCAVSHLSISPGEPAVFIPLKMDKYAFKEFGFQFGQAFQMLPGIVGIYNDYGQLSDVEYEPNYYQYAENGQAWIRQAKGEHDGDIEGWTYTWVHGDVYAAMVAGLPSSELDTRSVIAGSLPKIGILKKLGFIDAGETGFKRYTFKFETADVDDRFLASDGTWAELWIKGENGKYYEDEGPGLYTVQRLIDVWPGRLDVEALAGIRYYDWVVEEAIDEYRYQFDLEKRLAALIPAGVEINKEDLAYYASTLSMESVFALNEFERKTGTEKILGNGTLLEHLDEIKQDIADMAQFKFACSTCGVLITPAVAGPQFGDQPASLALASLVHELAEKKARKWDDEE